ncbi:MAG: helix-turn-helix transcriptional regulator [Aromatoleum sp.]|nr:helix-turn-helix transcriptional regulator [Aromatoleum sp.]
MLAEDFGTLVKEQRTLKRLKQADLARAANVSRTVLSRLEQGNARAVQTDVLDRLFAVLELSPRMVDRAAPDHARKHARLEQHWKREVQRTRHFRLAIELAHDERAAVAMIAKARERVELWRNKGSCSPYYIERWSQLLALPPRTLAKEMALLGEWEDALFQNSPWSWAWN